MKAFKIAVAVAIGAYCFWGSLESNRFGLLNGADLLFHEAGHVVFGFLGEFIGMLGGTLLQLIIPAAVVFEFIRRQKMYSASIALFWVAQNFFHISVYVKDARTMALPLVGGGIHDWNYMLGRVGLLPWDQAVGNLVWTVGIFILILSTVGGVHYALKSHE